MAPHTDEANLARIRDNQRRSRARRKEYQQELEQRVRAFEELGVEASTEVQQAARRVAEENRKLRALLQNNGISHASIEAYLQTGDFSAAMAATTAAANTIATTAGTGATTSTYSSALDRLMVPRYPAHYVSPLGAGSSGALSVSGSVGPSSPAGGSVGGGDIGGQGAGSDWETSMVGGMGTTHSSTSSPPVAMRTTSNRASGSHHSSHRITSDNKGKRVSAPGPATAAASASLSAHRHISSSAMMPTAATSSTNDYLTPSFDLSNAAFYGLDGASTEDLQYTSNEATFFDYSASPHYYGGASSGGGGGNVAAMDSGTASDRLNAMPGMNQVPGGATGYYGQVPSILSGSGSGACPACLSGMGCQVHGYYEE